MELLTLSDINIFFDYENYQKQMDEFIKQYLNGWKSILQTSMIENFKKKIMEPGYFIEFISKPKSERLAEIEYSKMISEQDSPVVLIPRGAIRKHPLMLTEISLPNN